MANHPTHASPIIKPLEPVPLFARRRWLLVQDWRYRLPDDTICLIPRGIIIDGASVPRPLNALVSPTGSLFVPSVIHDYGYHFDCLLIDDAGVIETRHEGAGRKYWDDLMFAIAEQRGQRPTSYHRTVWATLRLFGGRAWARSRKPKPSSFYQHEDRTEAAGASA